MQTYLMPFQTQTHQGQAGVNRDRMGRSIKLTCNMATRWVRTGAWFTLFYYQQDCAPAERGVRKVTGQDL